MKRPRTDDSTEAATEDNDGKGSNGASYSVTVGNGSHDVKPLKTNSSHVLIVGAGPGGLMLAYALQSPVVVEGGELMDMQVQFGSIWHQDNDRRRPG